MLDIETMREYIENKQYAKIRSEIVEMNEADIAAMLEELELPGKELIQVFRMLPKTIAADVFSFLSIELEQTIITMLTDREAATIIDNLFADDAADLMEEMPANVVKRLLAQTTPETRRDINHLLQYPEDSAGSIMTVEFVDLKEDYTVAQAIERIRKVGIDAMPVVDSEQRLVGIITVDDVMDIIEQEATEDIEMMAAITPTDKPYMKTTVFETFKKRIPWLLFLMISATFTGKIIQSYEAALASYAVLTMYIPMFMDTGGNAGGQSSVTIIRSISLGEVQFRDMFRIIWKEIRVAALCGVTLAIVNFGKLLLIDHVGTQVAMIVCLTMIVTVLVAKLVGCTLPMLAKKIGFDPAVMASPFITTIVDAVSLVIYFQIATRMLGI